MSGYGVVVRRDGWVTQAGNIIGSVRKVRLGAPTYVEWNAYDIDGKYLSTHATRKQAVEAVEAAQNDSSGSES